MPVALTYGLTETCSQATTTPVAEIGGAPASAGTPLFCTRLRIAERRRDPRAGPTVAPGGVAPDGWLHTGDLGELDERGRLRVSGRKADTIVSGGENVAPAEVEAVLESHPRGARGGRARASGPAMGRGGDGDRGARERASELDAEELRAHCAGALAPYKVPKQFVLATGPLPRTRSGKLLRRELR